jgi:hypothetical protein
VPSGDDFDDDAPASEPDVAAEPFYRGVLIRLGRGGGRGVVRSVRTGREVPFEREHAVVLGESGASGAVELREGMTVGYDVGWTSRGLRVTKIFPAPPLPREPTDPVATAAGPSGT